MLFNKLSKNDNIKNDLAENFVPDLVEILEDNFGNKNIVKQGIQLMADLSDNISGAENI